MNRFLLAAIAVALWLNLLQGFVRPTHAQSSDEAVSYLSSIADDVHALAHGGSGCYNNKICD